MKRILLALALGLRFGTIAPASIAHASIAPASCDYGECVVVCERNDDEHCGDICRELAQLAAPVLPPAAWWLGVVVFVGVSTGVVRWRAVCRYFKTVIASAFGSGR